MTSVRSLLRLCRRLVAILNHRIDYRAYPHSYFQGDAKPGCNASLGRRAAIYNNRSQSELKNVVAETDLGHRIGENYINRTGLRYLNLTAPQLNKFLPVQTASLGHSADLQKLNSGMAALSESSQ